MFDKLLSWFAAKRWRMSLSHCLEAVPLQIAFAVLSWIFSKEFNPFQIAAMSVMAVLVWYMSRKKLEVEIAAQQPGQSHAFLWAKGLLPWEYSYYQMLDVFFPFLSSWVVALVALKVFALCA